MKDSLTLADLFGDIPGMLALFLDLVRLGGKKPADAAVEVLKQRHANLFGIGRADEGIFETLRQFVPRDKRAMLDLILGKMRDYEERLFRLTVAAMACGNEVVDSPVKNPQKGQPTTTRVTVSWENTTKDLRIGYLQDIADEGLTLVADSVAKEAAALEIVKRMRARRLITRSPATKAALDAWAGLSGWMKENFLELFEVEELSEITGAMIAQKLDKHVEGVVAANPAVLSLDASRKLHGRPRGVFTHMAGHVRNIFRRA